MMIQNPDFSKFRANFCNENIAEMAWKMQKSTGNAERIFKNFGEKSLNILVNECRPEVIGDIVRLMKSSRTKSAIELRKTLIFILFGYDGKEVKGDKVKYLIPNIKTDDIIAVKYIDRKILDPRWKQVKQNINVQYTKKLPTQREVSLDEILAAIKAADKDTATAVAKAVNERLSEFAKAEMAMKKTAAKKTAA
uniref:Uncharacterized protein n=1 Tax=Podoviridae sp. ct2iq11 TaxID=2827720 RepID=A0A8S5TPH5_9CAUD|nr:MAG TPA: hypothetical protein [Podoviridae sp. ct2iq11]